MFALRKQNSNMLDNAYNAQMKIRPVNAVFIEEKQMSSRQMFPTLKESPSLCQDWVRYCNGMTESSL